MEYLTKLQRESLSLETLPEERRRKILQLKDSIKMTDEGLFDLGRAETQKLTNYSTSVLKQIKMKDFPDISGVVNDLMTEINKVDTNTLMSYKPSFLSRTFGKVFGDHEFKKFLQKFETDFGNANMIVDEIKKKLEDAKFQLKKDVIMCRDYMDQMVSYINELDDCIFAEQLKLKEYQEEIQNDMANLDKDDALATHMLGLKQGIENRLEVSIQDHMLIREEAVQNLNQLGLMKDGNTVLIEKIKKSIDVAIPIWESQMIVAFIVTRQQNCVDLEKAISDTTNSLITMNSELVKSGAIKIAKEMQRGIIDIETLKTSSQKLTETFNEVKRIEQEGREKREQIMIAISDMNTQMNEAMLLEEKKPA